VEYERCERACAAAVNNREEGRALKGLRVREGKRLCGSKLR